MIKPQETMFANLIAQFQRDLPLEPLTRIVNLAAVAVGVLRSKSLQLGQIVTALPLDGTRDTLKKRVQRFVKNPGVTVEVYAEPVARRILQRLAAGGARRYLTVDRTEWRTFNLLYVCGGWRGRALPLLWTPLGPGASSFAEQQALLTVVASWLPAKANVLLRGIGSLVQACRRRGLSPKAGGYVCACGPTSMCAALGRHILRCCPCCCPASAVSGLTSPSRKNTRSRPESGYVLGPNRRGALVFDNHGTHL
jgi:hypothetical protein